MHNCKDTCTSAAVLHSSDIGITIIVQVML